MKPGFPAKIRASGIRPRLGMIVVLVGIVGLLFGLTAAWYTVAALGEMLFAGGAGVANILTLMLVTVMIFATLLTLADRKWGSLIQNRVGPNRARIGLPWVKHRSLGGLPHILADAVKMLTKESFTPARANRLMFNLAPVLSFAPAFALFAVVPVGPAAPFLGKTVALQVASVDVGLLYVFGVASLAVYGTALAGWSSNNKLALLGGVRAASQMISYEVALGLSLVGVMMAFSTLRLEEMTAAQAPYLWSMDLAGFDLGLPRWGLFLQPIGFVLFFAAAFAETKRPPFDLPEGESEIIGYFLEYSGMRFGLFMISEYVEIVVLSGIIAAVFLGGYHLPFGELWLSERFSPSLMAVVLGTTFWVKVLFLSWVQMLIRWTLPRFRYDQIQTLGWRILLPIGLANVFATGALVLWDPSLRALACVGFFEIAFVLVLTLASKGAGEAANMSHAVEHAGH